MLNSDGAKFGCLMVAVSLLSGCAAGELLERADDAGPGSPLESRVAEKMATNDFPKASRKLKQAQFQFDEGNYGKASELYRDAAEETPKNPDIWLGLAASYDNIRRFDLADKAYKQASRLVGMNATLRNNLGYSYLLRGKLSASKRELLAAYNAAPGNPYILSNIDALNEKLAKLGRPTLQVSG